MKIYRQIAYRLRIQRGPGNPDKVSERPRASRGKYLDSDEQPTLIEFDEFDRADIPGLLALGAIVPWEVADGEAG